MDYFCNRTRQNLEIQWIGKIPQNPMDFCLPNGPSEFLRIQTETMADTTGLHSAVWDSQKKKILIVSMKEEMSSGSTTDSGFKGAAWGRIFQKFNYQTGLRYSKGQLQSQYKSLKKKYATFAAIINFGLL